MILMSEAFTLNKWPEIASPGELISQAFGLSGNIISEVRSGMLLPTADLAWPP